MSKLGFPRPVRDLINEIPGVLTSHLAGSALLKDDPPDVDIVIEVANSGLAVAWLIQERGFKAGIPKTSLQKTSLQKTSLQKTGSSNRYPIKGLTSLKKEIDSTIYDFIIMQDADLYRRYVACAILVMKLNLTEKEDRLLLYNKICHGDMR